MTKPCPLCGEPHSNADMLGHIWECDEQRSRDLANKLLAQRRGEQVLHAFQRVFPEARITDDLVDVQLTITTAEDEFDVEILTLNMGDRIVWHDFTHSTDLGPLDGSEFVSLLKEWRETKSRSRLHLSLEAELMEQEGTRFYSEARRQRSSVHGERDIEPGMIIIQKKSMIRAGYSRVLPQDSRVGDIWLVTNVANEAGENQWTTPDGVRMMVRGPETMLKPLAASTGGAYTRVKYTWFQPRALKGLIERGWFEILGYQSIRGRLGPGTPAGRRND